MAVLKKFNPATQQWEILQGGVQGLQGPPVALSKGTVTTTAAGTNADFSITGTAPNQKLNLTLPRGEAGGWMDAVALVDGVNLDTLTVSGLYVRTSSINTTVALKYPADGFAGYIEVIRTTNPAIIMQRATTLMSDSPASALNTKAKTWFRSLFSGTWGPWQRTPVIGDLSLDIVGAGRPDIPASMTTEVAALVAAATSGAKFRSTDGPQGAWEWKKRGTSWVCVEGDTGWRNLASLVVAGWDVSAGAAWVRRLGDVVYVLLRDIKHTTDNNEATALLLYLSAGFVPLGTTPFITAAASPKSGYIGGSGIYFPKRTSSGHYALFSYPLAMSGTSTAWPATLPGTAA